MTMKLKQVPETICPIQTNISIHKKISQKSKYFQQYSKIMFPVSTKQFGEYVEMLAQQNILFDYEYFGSQKQQSILIKVAKITRLGSLLTLLVSLGPFILQITIANCDQQSELHKISAHKRGGFGKIYFVKKSEELSTIKCLRLKSAIVADFFKATSNRQKLEEVFPDSQDGQKWKKLFFCFLKEYCFYRIFSALKIGPKANKLLGFDMVCFQNCIQFSIQKCSLNFFQKGHNYEKQIRQCFKIMHMFHIVHRDIKPDNVLFSPHYEQYVFTDFGTTQIIKQDIGYQSWSDTVVGTLGYMSKQLELIYSKWVKGEAQDYFEIDFYYNDLFALEQSIKQIPQLNNVQVETKQEQYEIFGANLAVYLVYCFYKLKQNELKNYHECIQSYAIWIHKIVKQQKMPTTQFNKVLRQHLYCYISQSDKGISSRCYINIYQKLEGISQFQIQELGKNHLRNMVRISTIERVQSTKPQNLPNLIGLYIKQIDERLGQSEYFQHLFVKLAKLVGFFKVNKNIPDDGSTYQQVQKKSYHFSIYCCQKCDKFAIRQDESIGSIEQLKRQIWQYIDEKFELSKQIKLIVNKLKLYFSNFSQKIQYHFAEIKKQKNYMKAIDLYFKMLLQYQNLRISDQFHSFANNFFIPKLHQNPFKQLIIKMLQLKIVGKIQQISQIQRLYEDLIASPKLLQQTLYGLLYVVFLLFIINNYFGCFKRVRLVQQQIVEYLQAQPATVNLKQAKVIFYAQLHHFYLFIRFKLQKIKWFQYLIADNANQLDYYKKKEQVNEYFSQYQIKLGFNSSEKSSMTHDSKQQCQSEAMIRNWVFDFSTKNKTTAQQIRKIQTIEEFKNISDDDIQWNLEKIFIQNNLHLFKKLQRSASFKTILLNRINDLISHLEFNFSLLGFHMLLARVGIWARQQPKATGQEKSAILQNIDQKLVKKNNLKSQSIKFVFYFQTEGQKYAQELKNKTNILETIFDLQYILHSYSRSHFQNNQEILLELINFYKEHELGFINPRFWFSSNDLKILQINNQKQDIFIIFRQACLNFQITQSMQAILHIIQCWSFIMRASINILDDLKILMQATDFLENEDYNQGILFYLTIKLLIGQHIYAEPTLALQKCQQMLNYWHQLFKFTNKKSFKSAKCLQDLLRSHLFQVSKKIYYLNLLKITKLGNFNYSHPLFNYFNLMNAKKHRNIDRYSMRFYSSYTGSTSAQSKTFCTTTPQISRFKKQQKIRIKKRRITFAELINIHIMNATSNRLIQNSFEPELFLVQFLIINLSGNYYYLLIANLQ